MAKSETEAKTKVLAEHGMTVAKPSPELKAGLQAIGKTMGEEWAKDAGDTGAEILKALQ